MPDIAQSTIDSEEECFVVEKKKKKKEKKAKYERGYYKGKTLKFSFFKLFRNVRTREERESC